MDEYISREDILDIASQYCADDDGSCSKADVDLREMLDEIEALPAADVQPVKHGTWENTNTPNHLRCSNCEITHFIAQYPHGAINYCPNCGADMRGDAQ